MTGVKEFMSFISLQSAIVIYTFSSIELITVTLSPIIIEPLGRPKPNLPITLVNSFWVVKISFLLPKSRISFILDTLEIPIPSSIILRIFFPLISITIFVALPQSIELSSASPIVAITFLWSCRISSILLSNG